jgi:hypothetical protein
MMADTRLKLRSGVFMDWKARFGLRNLQQVRIGSKFIAELRAEKMLAGAR